jgi:phosphoglucomutase
MEYLRSSMKAMVGNTKISKVMDYKLSIEKDLLNKKESSINLPKSNVLKFILEDGSWMVIRPSGTEPKMKVYLSVTGDSIEDSNMKSETLHKAAMEIIQEACK